MIDRTDNVLALLPEDDDIPVAYCRLSRAEQSWRGRLFFVTWLMYGSEAYAWAIALAGPNPFGGQIRESLRTVDDDQIVRDVQLLRRSACRERHI